MNANAAQAAVNLPAAIRPGATTQEIVTAFLSLASNASPDTVIQACNLITDQDAREKVFLLSLLGSIANKRVTDACTQALGIVLPAEWESKTENGNINFTNFAMLGHILFMLPDSKTGDIVNQFRPAYKKSLGGSDNLLTFGLTGVVPGKPKRQGILRDWSARFGSYNPATHEGQIRNLFPGIYGFGATSTTGTVAAEAASAAMGYSRGAVKEWATFILYWGAVAAFGGPLAVLWLLNGMGKKAGWVTTLVLASSFGFRPTNLQRSALSRSTSLGYGLLNAGVNSIKGGLRLAARVVKDPTAKEGLRAAAKGMEDFGTAVGPFVGQEAVRNLTSSAWTSLNVTQLLNQEAFGEAWTAAKAFMADLLEEENTQVQENAQDNPLADGEGEGQAAGKPTGPVKDAADAAGEGPGAAEGSLTVPQEEVGPMAPAGNETSSGEEKSKGGDTFDEEEFADGFMKEL